MSVFLALLLSSTSTVSDLYGPLPEGPVVAPQEARGLTRSGVEAEDVALLLPRLLLTPVEWVLLAISWPIDQLLRALDRYAVIEHLRDFLYNDARTAGVLPAFSFASSAGLAAGAKAFHHDLFGHDESISVSAKIGGIHRMSYDASFSADHLGDSPLWTELQLRYEEKPGLRFSGIGPELGPEARFRERRVLGRFRAGWSFGEEGARTKLGGSVVYNRRRFADDDGSIAASYDTRELLGFEEGVNLMEVTADLIMDHRDRPGFTSSGFLLEAFAGGAPNQGDYRFAHWGAELVGYIDLFKRTRVLVLRAGMEAVEAGPGRVPFSDLPRLGGTSLLRGWQSGSFRDEKSIFASIEYRWPVHANVEAHVFLDTGRVAPSYGGFSRDFGYWRFGTGGGVVIGSASDTILTIDVAYGDGIQFLLGTEVFGAFSSRTEEL